MNTKTIYLVDCENVGYKSINKPDATVYYFCTELKFKLSLGEFSEVVLHEKARNAMNLIVTTKLGYLINRYERNAKYIIVSYDSDFDVAINFWRDYGYDVTRVNKVDVEKPFKNKMQSFDIDLMLATLPSRKYKAVKNIAIRFYDGTYDANHFRMFLTESISKFYNSSDFDILADLLVKVIQERRDNNGR